MGEGLSKHWIVVNNVDGICKQTKLYRVGRNDKRWSLLVRRGQAATTTSSPEANSFTHTLVTAKIIQFLSFASIHCATCMQAQLLSLTSYFH